MLHNLCRLFEDDKDVKNKGCKGGSREIWVNECLMRPNGLQCDPAAEGQVGF